MIDLPFALVNSEAPIGALSVNQLPTLKLPTVAWTAPRSARSAVLPSLYVSTALMQALDVHSTLRALGNGGSEANPLMAGVTSRKGAFIATKAAVAAGTIFAARQIGKRNKIAAVATLVAINSAYAMVVHHNYRVAK